MSTPPTLPTQPDAEHLGPWRRWFEPLEAYVVMLWVLLACVLIPTWVQSDGSDVARQMLSPWTLAAVGLALVLREGGVDLSVWAVFTLAAVVAARLAEAGANPLWILTVVVCVGAAFGLVHAALTLLKAPSWVVTPVTAVGAMVLTGYLACGQVLEVDKDQLARWPGAENGLLLAGAFIVITVIALFPISMRRFLHDQVRNRRTLAMALLASAVLSAVGGLCWVLKDGRTPMPGYVFGDLRVAAAAVLAGAAVLHRPGRSATVCIMVPFSMVVVTVWWQWCWPTPTWPVDANLLALIVMLLAAQWSFRHAIARPGWRVKVWPILTGLGIVSLATAAGRAGERDLPRTLLGAALWLTGVSAVTIHWLRHRRRPAPAPQSPPSDPDKL